MAAPRRVNGRLPGCESENPEEIVDATYEAVERGAVADSRKNLIGNGRGLLSGRTGELLTQTLSCEPLNCRRMAAKCSFPRPPPTSSRV